MRPCAGTPAVAALVLAFAACGPSKETTDKNAVVSGVERLRAIPPADTSGRIAASDDLLRVQASTPDAIRARDACAKGYRLLAEANALTDGALAEMRDTSVRSDPQSLAARLRRAEELNAQAEPELATCKDAMAELAAKPVR